VAVALDVAARWGPTPPSTERFDYPDAHSHQVVVTAHVEGCSRLGASNGRWAVRIAPKWVFRLVTDAHHFGDFVDPRLAR
jgi:hypothetical protein